jgi:ubiquinone/menaquinone biosynthesis C-methylase UbiE
MKENLAEVQNFWNTEACGTHFVKQHADARDFYEQYRAFRYRTEWHIADFAQFERARGLRVLEIGCGNGADGAMFAMNGADYTGVDLTATAVEATRKHFAALGLRGAFQIENAEALSFADASFDLVYSYGVLHHTPHPARAFDEVYRVLKPQGHALIMLYHKRSFNYYARILAYMRLRALAFALKRAGKWSEDREAARARGLQGVRGNESPSVWQIHYENFLREGWSYFKAERFTHHCTDGPECPFAFVFSKREARKLFGKFSRVDLSVAHFPLQKYPFGKHIPRAFEKAIAAYAGWHLLISATK